MNFLQENQKYIITLLLITIYSQFGKVNKKTKERKEFQADGKRSRHSCYIFR
jgi:hypothetical protein